MTTMIRVSQHKATASDDGWANDAFYLLTRCGIAVREGVDDCTSWEECCGRDDGEEYVEMRVPSDAVAEALDVLRGEGFNARRSPD